MHNNHENKDNPHKTKHVEAVYERHLAYMVMVIIVAMIQAWHKTFNDQYYLDVIGTSYCRSRAIACTKE